MSEKQSFITGPDFIAPHVHDLEALKKLWIEIDSFYKKLSTQGAAIITPLGRGAFSPQFTFADIDGYSITVHRNK